MDFLLYSCLSHVHLLNSGVDRLLSTVSILDGLLSAPSVLDCLLSTMSTRLRHVHLISNGLSPLHLISTYWPVSPHPCLRVRIQSIWSIMVCLLSTWLMGCVSTVSTSPRPVHPISNVLSTLHLISTELFLLHHVYKTASCPPDQ